MPVFRIRDGKDNLDKTTRYSAMLLASLRKTTRWPFSPREAQPKAITSPFRRPCPHCITHRGVTDFNSTQSDSAVAIYSRCSRFLTDAYVTFGEPIEVSEYKEVYKKPGWPSINWQELEKRLKSMVVDISNDEILR